MDFWIYLPDPLVLLIFKYLKAEVSIHFLTVVFVPALLQVNYDLCRRWSPLKVFAGLGYVSDKMSCFGKPCSNGIGTSARI